MVPRNLTQNDDGTGGNVRRRLIANNGPGGADVVEVETPNGPVIQTVRTEVWQYESVDDALVDADMPGISFFLGLGDRALVFRSRPDGDWDWEGFDAVPEPVTHVGGAACRPDVTFVYYDFGDRLDLGVLHLLEGAIDSADKPRPWDRSEQQIVACPGVNHDVRREGTRVTRSERHATRPDGSDGPFHAGDAVVAECATVEEAKARFWGCVAELSRATDGGVPDPAIVGEIPTPS